MIRTHWTKDDNGRYQQNKNLIDISGEIRHETEKAYLFYDGYKEVWVPKSQCQWDPDAKEMTMSEWIAIDKGLI